MDPLQDPLMGDVSPLVNKFATVQAVIESARAYRQERAPGLSARSPFNEPLVPSVMVLVRNDTTADLSTFSVLTPTDTVIDPDARPFDARRKPVLSGAAPSSESDVVLVTFEPIAAGEIGRAVIGGVAVVPVEILDAGHEFAVAVPGDTSKLVSSATGTARLLVPSAGTTERKHYVLLNGGSGDSGGGGDTGEFYARLTESEGGTDGTGNDGLWKFIPIALIENEFDQLVWADAGDESDDYYAVPLLGQNGVDIGGSNAYPVAASPYSGMRVRLRPSGFTDLLVFEPLVQDFTPFLARLTSLHSQNRWNFARARCRTSPAEGGHDAISGTEVLGGLAYGVGFSSLAPYAAYHEVNNVKAGQVVLMWGSARTPGTYEFLPQQYAGEGSSGLVYTGTQRIPGPKYIEQFMVASITPGTSIAQVISGHDVLTDNVWGYFRTSSPVAENPYGTGLELTVTNANLPEAWRDTDRDKTFALGVDGERGVYVLWPNDPGVPGAPPRAYSHDQYAAAGANYHGVVSALSPYGIRLPTMLDGWGGYSGDWFNEPAPNTIYAKTGSSGTCFYKDSAGTEHDLLGAPSEIDGGSL